MVNVEIRNLKEIEEEYREQVEKLCSEKTEFYKELFKKYDKDLLIEIIFDHSSSKLYKVSASINLKSKRVLIAEEDKDVIVAVTKLFSEFKKAVKRQYELERKDYEYKRKR
jgi:ribosome-associated translation inhibitor RaiA